MKPQKQLVDGRMVDNDSIEWREECHARQMLTLSLNERKEMIERLESTSGKGPADRLRDQLRKVFDANKKRDPK